MDAGKGPWSSVRKQATSFVKRRLHDETSGLPPDEEWTPTWDKFSQKHSEVSIDHTALSSCVAIGVVECSYTSAHKGGGVGEGSLRRLFSKPLCAQPP